MRVIALAASGLIALLLGAAPAIAQPPADVDAQLTRLADKRKLQAELGKEIADLILQIHTKLLDQQKRLADLTSPPQPMPPLPPLVDPLKGRIADAFKADAGDVATKKIDAAKLAGTYSAAVEKNLAQLPELRTAGELIDQVRLLNESMPTDRLPGVRRLIAAELATVLKSHATPLTDELRAAAASLFARIEAALDEVSK